VLIEALTYRIGAHTTADDPRRYQPAEEIELWRARDPLPRFRRYLEQRSVWDQHAEQAAITKILAEIDAGIDEGEAIPEPAYAAYVEATRGGR
jgi:TPP-dependent pyruvate/acetoin dehydrogenase alpha subunit